MDPEPRDHQYPLRECQLTVNAAELITSRSRSRSRSRSFM
jgi:hypothetical protein